MSKTVTALVLLALLGGSPHLALAVDTAEQALNARRWSQAAQLADATLAQTPDDISALRIRGFARARLKDFSGSLSDFITVLATAPSDALAWHGAGKTLRMMEDLPAGYAANERALALAPDTPDYLVERGVNLFLAQKFAPSSAAFERVHALVPTYAGINAYRAELFLYLKDAAGARAAALEGLQREPDYGIHQINLAHAALFAGEHEKARALYLACANLIDMDGVTPGRELVPMDFAKMRAAGITVPGMEEVEALLANK